ETMGAHQRIEASFAGMTERRMADVMNESERFGKISVQAKSLRNGASDLRDFESVGEAIAKVIGVTRGEDLRFGFEAAKRTCVDDAVAIAGVFPAIRMRGFGIAAAARGGFLHGPRDKRGVAFDGCSLG